MSGLIQRPDTPLNGFAEGAFKSGLAIGVPMVGYALVAGWPSRLLQTIAFAVVFALGAALLGGLALAIWRVVENWAYERFTEGPPG